MASPSKKSKPSAVAGTSKARTFDKAWLNKYDWLKFEDGKMFSTLCIKHKKNVFVIGCTDFQNSSLVRHRDGQKHKDATKLSLSSAALAGGMSKLATKHDESLLAQLRTVYYICNEGLAIDKFESLMELQNTTVLRLILITNTTTRLNR